jgi:two-component system, NtrC family, sensor kinase
LNRNSKPITGMHTHRTHTDTMAAGETQPPENQLLNQRPTMSIRLKIVVSFSLFFLLCFTVTVWSYWILTRLENKIAFLEISDKYMVEIQQARRFEKNYLLYQTDLDDAIVHLKSANEILFVNKNNIKSILGTDHYRTMVQDMSKYHDQLLLLGESTSDSEKEFIVPKLRQFGGEMVSLAGDFVEEEQKSVKRLFLLAKRVPVFFILILFILIIFVVTSLVRQLLLALNRFMEYTKRIGEGDFSPITPARKFKDEFTKLAEAFNLMIKELDHKHNVLLESHKLRAIGTLVAGVAHELNNPLNNTLLTASMLKEDLSTLSEDEKIEMIDDVITETERSQKVVKNLLDFAREGETEIASLEIGKTVRDATGLVANQVKFAKIVLKINCEENLPIIHADDQTLKQVFVNLILNAVDALPPGGKIKIDVGKDTLPGYVLVSVHDNGPGMPEQIQSRIFEPFFTTKGQGKGTGLGLSVSRGIIKKLGGSLHFKSSTETGTTFMVSLPSTESPSEMMSKNIL